MKYLITGGCGFIGSNLASEVLKKGEELFILDNLYREGTYANLSWLQSQGKFKFYHADIRISNDVEKIIQDIKPDIIFHLAGQVAMTTSINNPRMDFETNVIGGHNLLEAIRKFSPNSIITYSSTNKVYGDMEDLNYKELETRYVAEGYEQGFNENVTLNFQSPYGCSKGAIDQYMLDYARIFKLNTIVFRHSSVFGGRQFSTYDQGWTGWFIKQALNMKNGTLKEPLTISGNGKQVRDLLFIDDLITCYFGAVNHISTTKGEVFNIGGGVKNSLSLLELFKILEDKLSIVINYKQLPWRESDQKVFIADTTKAEKKFGWQPQTDKIYGIEQMINWIQNS